ncbi:hypothetical protein PPYR_13259 [Photinus pyralis]|uniref:Uncharacterized protein n=1 Tax=Photinus pyralis TaxID=7054 RepID=A0A1Y1LTF1_PHOPY|nr:hypothetical protein PPYR_13259 [Photinus pyralis]
MSLECDNDTYNDERENNDSNNLVNYHLRDIYRHRHGVVKLVRTQVEKANESVNNLNPNIDKPVAQIATPRQEKYFSRKPQQLLWFVLLMCVVCVSVLWVIINACIGEEPINAPLVTYIGKRRKDTGDIIY